jgi:TfoX/Sxy family transcriptional regulator of competence genes
VAMKMPAASPEAAKRLEALLSGDPRVQLRKMFGQPAAFANGNLCVGTFGRELFVRLDEADVKVLSKTPGVRPFEPMPGRPMKQYLVVPPGVLGRPVEAKKWIQRSIEYALSLPPK